MEVSELIGTILLYFILPVLVILGTMVILRRKREKDAGRRKSTTQDNVKPKEIKDIKEEESYDARHNKPSPPNKEVDYGENKNSKT